MNVKYVRNLNYQSPKREICHPASAERRLAPKHFQSETFDDGILARSKDFWQSCLCISTIIGCPATWVEEFRAMLSTKVDPATIVSVLKGCLRVSDETVSLHQPSFDGNEWLYVKDCIDSGWVSSVGKYVDRFEESIAEVTGVKKVVAVVNGTAALQIALKMAGVQPDDEVLVPTLTFVATANAVSHCNAIPHFVDSEMNTLGVDPSKLFDGLQQVARVEGKVAFNRFTGRRISALIVVHTFGHPADLDALEDVCAKYNLVLIEDAAESIGSYYKNQHTGNRGRLSTLSFNGNKTITTGGGGAILTNDEELGRLAKHLTTTAKIPHRWRFSHDQVGFNYRLPNINAALGCAQLESLPKLLRQKRELAQRYEQSFKDIPGVEFFHEPSHGRSNYWLNALLLDDDQSLQRDAVLDATNDAGFQTRPAWEPMHTLAMYKDCPRLDVSVAERLSARLINLPSSPCLAPEQ